jgi:hypothetical protein
MTTLYNRIAGQSVERLAALRDGIFAVAIKRRTVIAQALYAFGVVLCVVNTYWTIAFIVAVQLFYAIAPRIPGVPVPKASL